MESENQSTPDIKALKIAIWVGGVLGEFKGWSLALAKAIQPPWRAFVLMGAYTGLRPGELTALRVDRLDLLRRQLRVEEPLKTRAARRTVSFPPFLAEELAHHLATHPGNNGRVFSAPEGGPIRMNTWRRRFWYPAVEASVGRPMRPHDLRHTHVALLIAEGEDPYVISKRLGHASIRTTYDTYGHLFKGRDRQAADRLEEAYRRAQTDTWRTTGSRARLLRAENPCGIRPSDGGGEGI
ncbi:MAG: site-specific integrase [Acidimicrobiia bacterium]|nr:site-specific integrase [Acidimicrobiia bacterium]